MTEKENPRELPPEVKAHSAEWQLVHWYRSRLYINWISLFGLFVISIGVFTAGVTLALDFLQAVSLAYSGILFLVYFAFVLIGMAVIPVGILIEGYRRKKAGANMMGPDLVLDLRIRAHRLGLFGGIAGVMFLLMAMAAGSYQVYHITESNEFCGNMCHQVMSPEYTTYAYSSHARVDCVECHIGSGAEWYVRSKFSGIRQVFAVMMGNYPKPIPTPIHNLRPARDTCEQCHWPKKFIGYREQVHSYYHGDETSTPFGMRLILKIGGEEHSLMKGSGIHYHMMIANSVEYMARDQDRLEIPWVRITHDGRREVFEDTSNPLSAEEKAALEIRTMDCMDCHNRPSHQFPVPGKLVNQALGSGAIDSSLPYIKRLAVKALDGKYKTTEQGEAIIEKMIIGFYKDEYPEVYQSHHTNIKAAANTLKKIFRQSFFPEMKARYSAYPDHIGHRDWPGCFRCHNDKLESASGKTIFTECSKCHLIISQGEDISRLDVDINKGLDFIHPDEDREEMVEYTDCTECHSGGADLYEDL
ncbi:MAG: NapC/NirT family cytochrome c [Deltaproteobacteria bacterium]|nr:NapC/NirT family cytochrome c [Deltaproteobacteria bacterium]